jgi:high-affinity iron transporter
MSPAVLSVLVLLSVPEGPPARTWQRVVSLAQYLESDYPKALATHDAAELTEQAGLAQELVEAVSALGPEGAALLGDAKALEHQVDAQGDGRAVQEACRALAAAAVAKSGLEQSPHTTPDLAEGARVFEGHCASCHGATGHADTAAARALTPAPASFHDAERMGGLSPFRVFNTLAVGVSGTAMAAFPQLSEAERWAVSFYVFTLRQPPCEGPPPVATLQGLSTSSDLLLAATHGAGQVACLRRRLPKVDALSLAVSGVAEARALGAQGRFDEARQALVDAYLLGVEPVEPQLKARDAALVAELETGFTQARLEAQAHHALGPSLDALSVTLRRAEHPRAVGGFWSVFFASLFILLREGFEATIVVGALLAVLKKLGATASARVVHLGWVSALVFGAGAFVFAQAAFAGAQREWVEAVTGLVAVALLLYAALWLNRRATVSRQMGRLRGQMTDALGQGSAWGLFTISFTSVGRETVETALFLQGLALDSREGVWWGAAGGLLALVGVVLLVRTVGFVLPMKTLFTASTWLLVGTAVMLAGSAAHGLQELGVLALRPVPFIELGFLGIFPDATSLLAQLAVALVPALFFWWQRPGAGGLTPPAGVAPTP